MYFVENNLIKTSRECLAISQELAERILVAFLLLLFLKYLFLRYIYKLLKMKDCLYRNEKQFL